MRISISAMALYDPAEHRSLAMRFCPGPGGGSLDLSVDEPCGCLAIPRPRSQTLSVRSTDAREIGQAATLMNALFHTSMTHIACGKYVTANALLNELVALADEKGSSFWNAQAMLARGRAFGDDR